MKYSKGSIIRIHLKNFLAFDEIELHPKNKLNLIVGANGSGKSTFVCAIVLGLGGKPTIIGRSPNVSDYVKHGRQKATIELELFNPNGDNYIIKRKITSDSQTTWYLQENKVPFKKIEALTEELNIQINNLCQILPQDRVQDFAKMDQKELLENTQNSIGDPEMCEQFHKLKSFRKKITERHDVLADKILKYKAETDRNQRMEAEVKSYQEKQDILNKISLIKKKLQWILHEEKNEARKKLQDEYKIAHDKYERLKNTLQPHLTKVKEAEKKQSNILNKMKAQSDHNHTLNNKLKDFVRKNYALKDKIDRIKEELKSKIEAEAQKEKHIAEIQKHIKELEEQLPKMNETAITNSIKEASAEIDTLVNKIAGARTSESEVKDKAMTINQSIRALEHKVQQLNSVKEKKLEILSNYQDVRQAYEWLQENRHQFQGAVYGPMFMELNVENPNHARYIEHIVSWKDLVAFVCEDAKDMTKLLRILRDGKKLKINAIHSAPPQQSLTEMFPPRFSINQLRKFGFQYFLFDLITGPDPLLKFLCTNYNIHNIPLGNNQVEDHLDRIPKELRAFFTENSFYRVKYSKYTGEKVQNVTTVGRSRFLSISINRELLATCNEELARKQEEYREVQIHLSQMAEMKNKFEFEINMWKNKKREFSRSFEQLKASNVRLKMKREELAEIMQRRIDPSHEEAKSKLEIENCIKEMLAIESEHVKVITQYSESCTSICLLKIQHDCAGHLVKKCEKDARELETTVIAARDEVERLKSECVQIRLEVKNLHKKAIELCEGLDATDERFKEKYGPLFKSLPGNRIQLEDLLYETDAMAKCFQGNFDEKVLNDYKESSRLLLELDNEIEKLRMAATGIQEEANDILACWLPKIENLLEAINDRFGAFFAAMGCAGVVELDKGPDSTNYENYGLKIKVKFRNEGELQALNSHTQSGGERALTTAVYLLSLQAITTVPFRCVDEINQGMDEINEKRVYHLIMNSISTCDTAQYFLVTPTLFPNVEYPEGTCVHCVHCSTHEDDKVENFKWSKEAYFKKLGITTRGT